MAELAAHWAYLDDAWRGAQAAPLSQRKALLVALLIDAYVDRLFAERAEHDDILAFRSGLGAASPALRSIMDLAGQREARLVTKAVQVPLEDYGQLGVGDFMVSLYNDHSVQRVLIVRENGTQYAAHDMLEQAIAWLRHEMQGEDRS